MSRSEPKAHLRIEGERRALEVVVIDSDFTPVARGVGGLDVELDAGLYEVQFRAGPAEDSVLVKLTPAGEHVVPAPKLSVPSAAPVEGTSTSHEYQQHAAVEASAALNAAGSGSGLVVMVRNVRGQDEIPFERDRIERLMLLDGRLDGVAEWAEGWHIDEQEKWAWRALSLPPGPYALASPGRHGERIDQSLWVSDGWQTLVFIPNTSDGPAPEHATVHMTRIGFEWSPWGDGSDIGLALEGALWGLRAGRPMVPDDLAVLLRAKFENPILGIVGAHGILLEQRPRIDLLDVVLGNLSELIPGHPDLIALQHLTDAAARRPFVPHGELRWPPLLLASYVGAIRVDAEHPGVLAAGSRAEQLAAQLVIQGLWTAWSTPAEPELLTLDFDEGRSYRPMVAPDPAIERLSAYANGAAKVRGVSPETILRSSVAQLSRATGLSAGSVSRAVRELLPTG